MPIDLQERIEIRELGSGGFGRTTLCEDKQQHRFVLKIYAPEGYNDSPKALRMFKDECDRLQEVGNHNQIPSYLGFEETVGSYAIAQQYIPGRSLGQILDKDGPYSPEQVLSLLEQLLDPLDHLHKSNVIHRDIKPDNIIVRTSDQLPCIVDFGAAKVATETVLAKTGTMIGTASYAAPEQLAGQTSFQSDIYSLGLTIIEMLTNQSPFTMIDFSTGEWTWPAAVPDLDPRIKQILHKMTQRNLRDRYVKIEQIQKDISDYHRYSLQESERLRVEAEKEARALRRKREKRSALRKTIIRKVLPSVLVGGLVVSGGSLAWQKLEVGDRVVSIVESLTPKPRQEESSLKKRESELNEENLVDLIWFMARGCIGLGTAAFLANIILRSQKGY